MLKYEYGNKNTDNILIQMVDDHDISEIPSEMEKIRGMAKDDFCLKGCLLCGRHIIQMFLRGLPRRPLPYGFRALSNI